MEGFWEDFWKDLTLQTMIRATKGISMDGWMDGWKDGSWMDGCMDGEDLIICVAIWTLYKLWVPLTSDEFRMIPIASRNKLRFTSLLGSIFKDFGSPNGFPNSVFKVLFSRRIFLYIIFFAFHCSCQEDTSWDETRDEAEPSSSYHNH